MAALPLTNWNTGLFGCCEDTSSCCYGFWCCPCLACTVSGTFGENRCLPLCDIFSPAITAACGLPLCAPPAGLSLRAAMRNRYGVKGSLCKDIATSCVCSWCSWCQMHRELKYRKKNSVVVVNMQPGPVMMAPGHPPPAGFVSQSGVVVASY
ncbi:cornifelin-like [Siniperca chuatsi]|uniref:cornifelin-like n=1 Tax=Siniperca chuatsi TaxID=119488 RepID=UPI001CE0292A|nr:cornifelin-like [Siniperca chuatsi]XP_044055421.1 cornifelin-like [Siniperca chuatsi]